MAIESEPDPERRFIGDEFAKYCYDFRAVLEHFCHSNVKTNMVGIHVLNRNSSDDTVRVMGLRVFAEICLRLELIIVMCQSA